MLTDLDIIAAVRELNAEIYDKTDNEEITLEAQFNGVSAVVMFLGVRLWFEDEDERVYDAATDTHEPLIDFLKRRVVAEIEKLDRIASWWKKREE